MSSRTAAHSASPAKLLDSTLPHSDATSAIDARDLLISELDQPSAAVATRPSTRVGYSCALPAAMGFVFGAVPGYLANFGTGDGRLGALRWGVAVGINGTLHCALIKQRGGVINDGQPHYDRALSYSAAAFSVPLTDQVLRTVWFERRSRASAAPGLRVLQRASLYGLMGFAIGFALDYFQLALPDSEKPAAVTGSTINAASLRTDTHADPTATIQSPSTRDHFKN